MTLKLACALLAIVLGGTFSSRCAAEGPATQPVPPATQPTDEQLTRASVAGFTLNAMQVHDLKEQIKLNPADAAARAELLGYFMTAQNPSADDIKDRREQVLWMINNLPAGSYSASPDCEIDPISDPSGYKQAYDLWMKQIDLAPQSAAVLGNAAQFMEFHDPAKAEELLGRAMAADPTNPQWPEDLAHLHLMGLTLRTPAEQQAKAKQALGELEQSLALTPDPQEQYYLLSDLAKMAFTASDAAKATLYAKRLLSEAKQLPFDWNYGNAIYTGNLILGRVALAANDVASAKTYLLAAAATPGSPQLNSFGPNMTLARDLLARGERDTVLEFFQRCGKFWTMGADTLKQWTKVVKNGGTPDWGPNLDY
jgi:tetratricopeptide (TPR) repeat protein